MELARPSRGAGTPETVTVRLFVNRDIYAYIQDLTQGYTKKLIPGQTSYDISTDIEVNKYSVLLLSGNIGSFDVTDGNLHHLSSVVYPPDEIQVFAPDVSCYAFYIYTDCSIRIG